MGAGLGLGLDMVLKDLKDEMATSGDGGERRWRALDGAVICQ